MSNRPGEKQVQIEKLNRVNERGHLKKKECITDHQNRFHQTENIIERCLTELMNNVTRLYYLTTGSKKTKQMEKLDY